MSEHQSTPSPGNGACFTWANRTNQSLVTQYQPGLLDPTRPPTQAEAEHLLTLLPDTTLPDMAPLPPGSYLPGMPDAGFVGRAAELRELAQALKQPARAAAISGPGGMGKTQLALAFAARYGQFFAGGVYWIRCTQTASIPADIAACGAGMDLHPGFAALPQNEQVRLVLAAWRQPMPRLLIFDGCEEPDLLRQWWPDSGGCHVLLTSRQPVASLPGAAHRLALDVLPRDESHSMLAALLDPEAAHAETLDDLVSELGNLPLALRLARACLHRYPHLPPVAYLARLRDLPAEQGHVGRAAALSYQQLADDTLRDLLGRALCCAWDEPIPPDLLLANQPPEALEALEDLLDLGLLTVIPGGTLVLHSLLAACIQPYANPEAARPHVEAALLHALATPPTKPEMIPHLHVAVAAAGERHDEPTAALCHHLGQHLKQSGDYAAAVTLLERARAIRMHLLGLYHSNTASSLALLADLRREQGDYNAAAPLFEQLLARQEEISGPWHLRTAMSLTNLAGVRREQGDYNAAAALFVRALAIREQRLGLWHPRIATTLAHLADVRYLQGDQTAARRLTERARLIREQALGLRLPQLVISLIRMAEMHEEQGEYSDAVSLLRQAVGITEQTLGSHHPHIAGSLTILARLRHIQNDIDSARVLLERALNIYEAIYGPEHPEVATGLNNLAGLLYDNGDNTRARSLLERACAICERALEPQHPDTAGTLHNLAVLLFDEGEVDHAADLMRRALAIRCAALGEDDPDTEHSRQSLAAIEAAQA
jgi:tetratricopeptide (TPR) repeat protein